MKSYLCYFPCKWKFPVKFLSMAVLTPMNASSVSGDVVLNVSEGGVYPDDSSLGWIQFCLSEHKNVENGTT